MNRIFILYYKINVITQREEYAMTQQPDTAISLENLSLNQRKSYTYHAVLVISLCASFLFYKYIIQNFPSVISAQLMSEFNLQGLGLGMLSGG